jgi:hypothetical protein
MKITEMNAEILTKIASWLYRNDYNNPARFEIYRHVAHTKDRIKTLKLSDTAIKTIEEACLYMTGKKKPETAENEPIKPKLIPRKKRTTRKKNNAPDIENQNSLFDATQFTKKEAVQIDIDGNHPT